MLSLAFCFVICSPMQNPHCCAAKISHAFTRQSPMILYWSCLCFKKGITYPQNAFINGSQLLGTTTMPQLTTLWNTALSNRSRNLAKSPKNIEKVEAMLQTSLAPGTFLYTYWHTRKRTAWCQQTGYQLPRSRSSLLSLTTKQLRLWLNPSQKFSFEKEVIHRVNTELASEVAMWKAKCEEQQKCIDCTLEQVRLYNPHNARRREKRKVRLNEQKQKRGQIEPLLQYKML